MNPDAFIKGLKREVPLLTVCTGEEAFFKEEVFLEIRETLAEIDSRLQVVHWEGAAGGNEKAEARRLVSEMETPGLFSPVKLILCRDAQKLFKAAAKEFAALLDSSIEKNHLVLFIEKADGRTAPVRRLKEEGCLVECRPLRGEADFFRGGGGDSELARWARARSSRHGIGLTREAAAFLVSHTGNNLFLVDSELGKLACAVEGKRSVRIPDIEAVTGTSALHTPFELWERIESGSVGKALETLGVILRNGMRSAGGQLVTDHAGIAAILLKIFRDRIRLAAAVKVFLHEGETDRRIQEMLSVRSAFYFGKIKSYGLRLTARRYGELRRSVLEAERRIKRQGQDAAAVLEETVVRLAAANGTKP